MRAAILAKDLRSSGEDWVLVLPPWPRLYHWKSRAVNQMNVRWEVFFHLPSLNEYVPAIEFHDYTKRVGKSIEEVVTKRLK